MTSPQRQHPRPSLSPQRQRHYVYNNAPRRNIAPPSTLLYSLLMLAIFITIVEVVIFLIIRKTEHFGFHNQDTENDKDNMYRSEHGVI